MTSQISPAQTPNAAERQPLIKKVWIALGITAIVLVVVGLVALILWLANSFPAQIEAMRDIFIIFLALGSCLSGIVIILMLIMIIRLVNMLEFEIKPILEKTNETLGTVQGTTKFVSTNVVQPSIKATSYVAGARRAMKVLFGDPRKNLPD